MKKILGKIMSGNKQQGIALLFALAILSLLMVMAMGFAVSSIFEQKAANNSANTSSARFLAQSVLNRVLVLVNMYGDIVQSSHETSGDKDMLSHLSLDVAGAPLYAWTAGDEVTWEYLTMNDGTSNRMLGRFAYKVIPVAGLDPGALVRNSVNEAAVTAAEQRLGVYVDEINLRSISSDIAVTPTAAQVAAQKFNYTTLAAAPGLYPGPATGWQSFQNMFEKTGITDETLQSRMLRWFVLDTGRFKSKEAYWVDQNDPKYYHRFNLARTDWDTAFDTKEEMYEKILLDKNSPSSSVPDGVPDQLPLTCSAGSVYQDGYGIPWLAFFGYDKTGVPDITQGATFGSSAAGVIARRRQIAANLVDYCRTDTTPPTKLPMSDVAPAAWYNGTTWGAIPTFTGNKKTPYINELGFHIMVEGTRTPDGASPVKGKGKGHGYGRGKKTGSSTTATIDLCVDMEATVELVDVYNISTLPSVDSTLTVDCTWSFDVTGTVSVTTVTVPETLTFNINNTSGGDWYVTGTGTRVFYASADWKSTVNTQNPIDGASISKGTAFSYSVNNIKVKVNKAVLNYNGINYDYANINTTSPAAAISGNIAASSSVSAYLDNDMFVSFQALDPRQNLNAGDWTVTKSAVLSTYDPAQYNANGGSIGLKNNNIGTTAAGLDPETAADRVTGASTAFIRQGPMQSPWELGLIHRGKAWETINLKEFDPNKNFKYIAGTPVIIPGGGKYSDTANGGGDANILDQVKMNSTVDNFKVNINSEFQEPPVTSTSKYTVLEALFKNIKTGCTNIATPETGTPLSDADISGTGGLIPTIVAKTKDYTNRAQVVTDIVGALPISNYTTDAKKEELIGKFINLTDICGRYYYIIVLAQTIKDVGGTSTAINIKKTKNGASSTWPCKIGVFDFDNVKSIYFDEIVAEQKIKVLMYEPPSGNPIIVSYEFVE